jgi:hypothetical protein
MRMLKKALKSDAVPGDDPVRVLLNTAFHSATDWAAFGAAVTASSYLHTQRFVTRNDKQVSDQVDRRAGLPQHHSIAALEGVLTRVRESVERRAFTFRNQRRTNLLLGLMRNHEMNLDQLDRYAELLRDAALASGGRIRHQRAGYLPGRRYDLRP